MRIWLVPFSELDDQRLVAQHHEFHAVAGHVINRGYKWKGWEKPEHRLEFLSLHEELEREFELRGFTHNLDTHRHDHLEMPRLDVLLQKPYPRDPAEMLWERWTLMTRWRGEFKGRAGTRDALEQYLFLEREYKEHGCEHDWDWEDMGDGKERCLLCKEVYRDKTAA